VLPLTRLDNIKLFFYINCQIIPALRKENFSGLLVEEHLHCSVILRKSLIYQFIFKDNLQGMKSRAQWSAI